MFKEDHLSFRQRKYMKVKNIIGRALGGIGLVVLSPVYLAIIVAIKKEDGITAPVFFSQKIKYRNTKKKASKGGDSKREYQYP